MQDFALQAGQCKTVGSIGGDHKAALDKLQRRLLTIFVVGWSAPRRLFWSA